VAGVANVVANGSCIVKNQALYTIHMTFCPGERFSKLPEVALYDLDLKTTQ